MSSSPPASPLGSSSYSRGLARLSVITACAVFLLISVGSGVTSKGAGMAYPDGFTSNGYLIGNPPGWWASDSTRWEHGHRLLGRAVGLLSIILAIWCWRHGGSIRVLGVANLLAVCAQGVLGAYRVYEVSTSLAMLHGIFAQLCFCLTCTVALVTCEAWQQGAVRRVRAAGFLQRLCLAGVAIVLIQLITGAAYRHFHNRTLLMTHIFLAAVVTFVIGWLAMWLMGLDRGRHLLTLLGRSLALLMIVQLLLGGAAFMVKVMGRNWSGYAIWVIPSAHVAVGALLLACTILIAISAFRLLRPAPERASNTAEMIPTP